MPIRCGTIGLGRRGPADIGPLTFNIACNHNSLAIEVATCKRRACTLPCPPTWGTLGLHALLARTSSIGDIWPHSPTNPSPSPTFGPAFRHCHWVYQPVPLLPLSGPRPGQPPSSGAWRWDFLHIGTFHQVLGHYTNSPPGRTAPQDPLSPHRCAQLPGPTISPISHHPALNAPPIPKATTPQKPALRTRPGQSTSSRLTRCAPRCSWTSRTTRPRG